MYNLWAHYKCRERGRERNLYYCIARHGMRECQCVYICVFVILHNVHIAWLWMEEDENRTEKYPFRFSHSTYINIFGFNVFLFLFVHNFKRVLVTLHSRRDGFSFFMLRFFCFLFSSLQHFCFISHSIVWTKRIKLKWNETKRNKTKWKSNTHIHQDEDEEEKEYIWNENSSMCVCVFVLNGHQEMSCEMCIACVSKMPWRRRRKSPLLLFLKHIFSSFFVHIAFSCWQNQSYTKPTHTHTTDENKTFDRSRDCLEMNQLANPTKLFELHTFLKLNCIKGKMIQKRKEKIQPSRYCCAPYSYRNIYYSF